MSKWAKIKGIDLLGTGDFTHKKWREEIGELLEEKDGVFKLRGDLGKMGEKEKKGTKFLLTGEISSIYKQGDKVRKIHNLITVRSLEVAEKICNELEKRKCNLKSDGRPIIGISAKNLLELVLNIDKDVIFIPCHIWTPWFSLYGEKSGFNSIEECFGDLSKFVGAVETGISSDPAMNWIVPDLNNKNIVSFSDAHSLENIGREATVLEIQDTKWGYEEIRRLLLGNKEKLRERGDKGDERINYTIEFYPQEGKYHYSGHRKCGVVFSPQETLLKGNICP
jgi:PHP family Zn ribbon phosphoesterase